MQGSLWKFAVVLLLICPGKSSKDIQTCNQTIHISCVPYQFILVHSNGTTSLTANILKKCNSHQECQVENLGRECVQLAYLRRKEQQHTFQIEEASNLDQYEKLSLFSLMSEGYPEAHSMNAANISCSLKLSNGGDTSSKNMSIEIYEFASFTNVSDYCLYMNNTEKPLVCSGSKTIYQSHGPFNSRNGWQWSMKLVNTQIQTPKVRFWIGISVSPNDESMYHLECHSQPVSRGKKNELTLESPKTVDASKIVSYVVIAAGGLLIIVGLAICWWKWPRGQLDYRSDIYFELPAANVQAVRQDPEPNMSTRSQLPQISDRRVINVRQGLDISSTPHSMPLEHTARSQLSCNMQHFGSADEIDSPGAENQHTGNTVRTQLISSLQHFGIVNDVAYPSTTGMSQFNSSLQHFGIVNDVAYPETPHFKQNTSTTVGSQFNQNNQHFGIAGYTACPETHNGIIGNIVRSQSNSSLQHFGQAGCTANPAIKNRNTGNAVRSKFDGSMQRFRTVGYAAYRKTQNQNTGQMVRSQSNSTMQHFGISGCTALPEYPNQNTGNTVRSKYQGSMKHFGIANDVEYPETQNSKHDRTLGAHYLIAAQQNFDLETSNANGLSSRKTAESLDSLDSIAMKLADNELYQSTVTLDSSNTVVVDNEIYDAEIVLSDQDDNVADGLVNTNATSEGHHLFNSNQSGGGIENYEYVAPVGEETVNPEDK